MFPIAVVAVAVALPMEDVVVRASALLMRVLHFQALPRVCWHSQVDWIAEVLAKSTVHFVAGSLA